MFVYCKNIILLILHLNLLVILLYQNCLLSLKYTLTFINNEESGHVLSSLGHLLRVPLHDTGWIILLKNKGAEMMSVLSTVLKKALFEMT